MKATQLAFATDTKKPTLKKTDQQEKKSKDKNKTANKLPCCLCGKKMWYADCPYFVPSKTPPGRKKNVAICKKIDDALKDIKIQERVRKNIETWAKLENSGNLSSSSGTSADAKAFTTILHTALTTHTPGIESFLIHDGRLSVHVCNNASAHFYTKLQNADQDEYLCSNTGIVMIKSWGRIKTA